jgi:hypothetical protein
MSACNLLRSSSGMHGYGYQVSGVEKVHLCGCTHSFHSILGGSETGTKITRPDASDMTIPSLRLWDNRTTDRKCRTDINRR